MDSRIIRLNSMLTEANNIVFFTGVGISTSAGIPDFRSSSGMYNKFPEEVLSAQYAEKNHDAFLKFLRDNLDTRNAEPTLAHKVIAELQEKKNVTVITQNIDGLHELAGSRTVHNIHGSFAYSPYCLDCGQNVFLDTLFSETHTCPHCGGTMPHPDIVLYGESMRHPDWQDAIVAASQADILVVVGTSLSVYPAANILYYFGEQNWDKLVIINRDSTEFDVNAELVFHEDIQDVFKEVRVYE